MLIEILKTIILGIVQGITEWLPISSTGHMILVNQFLHLNFDKAFVDLFMVVIQFGSILAVITLYFNRLNPFGSKKTSEEKKQTWNMWLKVMAAVLPAAVIGLKYDDVITQYCYNSYVVAAALIIYGILFIVIENRKKFNKIESISNISYKTALLIGLFQVLALIPGTSRSGATILGAILLGLSRKSAAEFSFFLAIPVMLGASALKIFKYIIYYGFMGASELIVLLAGMLTAYIVSLFVIKFLMRYIKNHNFKAFGYYRIVLGILILLYFAFSGASIA